MLGVASCALSDIKAQNGHYPVLQTIKLTTTTNSHPPAKRGGLNSAHQLGGNSRNAYNSRMHSNTRLIPSSPQYNHQWQNY
jgi:hypothetical protein